LFIAITVEGPLSLIRGLFFARFGVYLFRFRCIFLLAPGFPFTYIGIGTRFSQESQFPRTYIGIGTRFFQE
jgi:hypothetical protein